MKLLRYLWFKYPKQRGLIEWVTFEILGGRYETKRSNKGY